MYKIVRFYSNERPPRTIKKGLTLAEAQAHCQTPKTEGGTFNAGTAWFDGYESE